VPDVRDILREGADIQPGLPDVPDLVRRGRRARRRRAALQTVAAAACAVAVVALGTLLVPDHDVPEPQPAAPVRPDPVPSSLGPLPVGVYDASSLGLDLTFTVPGPGWTLTTAQDGWVGLRHDRTTLVLQRWDEVVDPDADPVGPTDVGPVPDDLVAWLTSHPRLAVDGVSAVPLGDETWTAVEITVARALTRTPAECKTLRCVLLAVSGDEPAELLARDRARVLVAPGPGLGGAVVVVLTRPDSQTRPDPGAETVVDSLRHE
jgi:hypothetical protein